MANSGMVRNIKEILDVEGERITIRELLGCYFIELD